MRIPYPILMLGLAAILVGLSAQHSPMGPLTPPTHAIILTDIKGAPNLQTGNQRYPLRGTIPSSLKQFSCWKDGAILLIQDERNDAVRDMVAAMPTVRDHSQTAFVRSVNVIDPANKGPVPHGHQAWPVFDEWTAEDRAGTKIPNWLGHDRKGDLLLGTSHVVIFAAESSGRLLSFKSLWTSKLRDKSPPVVIACSWKTDDGGVILLQSPWKWDVKAYQKTAEAAMPGYSVRICELEAGDHSDSYTGYEVYTGTTGVRWSGSTGP